MKGDSLVPLYQNRAYKFLILNQADGRGVKDPERLKRQQKRREDAEREALRHGPSDGGLKVSTFWHEQVNLLYF